MQGGRAGQQTAEFTTRAAREGERGRQRNSLLSDRTSSRRRRRRRRAWTATATSLLHGPLSDHKETKERFSPPLRLLAAAVNSNFREEDARTRIEEDGLLRRGDSPLPPVPLPLRCCFTDQGQRRGGPVDLAEAQGDSRYYRDSTGRSDPSECWPANFNPSRSFRVSSVSDGNGGSFCVPGVSRRNTSEFSKLQAVRQLKAFKAAPGK